MAKESFSRSDVKNIKHGAVFGGLILGALATIGVGICRKKTTNANLTNGTTDLFDKAVDKVKLFLDERKNKKEEVEETDE